MKYKWGGYAVYLCMLICVVLITNDLSGQTIDPFGKMELKGKVMRITEYIIEPSGDTDMITTRLYNRNGGCVLVENSKRRMGAWEKDTSETNIYIYNSSNQLKEQRSKRFTDSEHIVNRYNKDGELLVTYDTTWNWQDIWIREYRYDPLNKRYKLKETKEQYAERKAHVVNEYDEKGYPSAKYDTTWYDGRIYAIKYVYKTDKKGNITEEDGYSGDTLKTKKFNTYSDTLRLNTVAIEVKGDTILSENRSYNDKKLLTAMNYHINKSEETIKNYDMALTYTPEGNFSSAKMNMNYGGQWVLITVQWSRYDNKGNWLEEKTNTYTDDSRNHKCVRSIEYYQ